MSIKDEYKFRNGVQMLLNADLGESFGKWTMGYDSQIMPLIDQASIACGYHAGDALVMKQSISLACKHDVSIGAHVSYPDIQGFGRRSMNIETDELVAMIQAQIASLDGLAQCQGRKVEYVKPHGALYNDMMRSENIFDAVLLAISGFHRSLDLFVLAKLDNSVELTKAKQAGINLILEGFADRAYTKEGLLMPRSLAGSVLNHEQALVQAMQFSNQQAISCGKGESLNLKIDTLCVHGDTKDALLLCQDIRRALSVV